MDEMLIEISHDEWLGLQHQRFEEFRMILQEDDPMMNEQDIYSAWTKIPGNPPLLRHI